MLGKEIFIDEYIGEGVSFTTPQRLAVIRIEGYALKESSG